MGRKITTTLEQRRSRTREYNHRYYERVTLAKRAGRKVQPRLGKRGRPTKMESLHNEWRRTHILRCEDYPKGICCSDCHGDRLGLMEEIEEVGNGKVAYICCWKRITNLVNMIPSNIFQHAEIFHGLPERVKKERHNPHDISKLPKGLLKSWLKSKLGV